MIVNCQERTTTIYFKGKFYNKSFIFESDCLLIDHCQLLKILSTLIASISTQFILNLRNTYISVTVYFQRILKMWITAVLKFTYINITKIKQVNSAVILNLTEGIFKMFSIFGMSEVDDFNATK